MKKFLLSIALCCAATNFFAQTTEPGNLINEGKAALEAKNYQEAFTKFSTYLTQTNNQDSVIAYNCGVCADKIKKPEEALKYFDIAIQKKYNLGNAYVGKAGALKDLKKDRIEKGQLKRMVLKEGIEAAPENKTLKRLHANYYLNAGIKAQKANKLDDAEEAFKQVLADDEKNTNALYSLGTLSYNKAALVLKNAAPLANSDKAKYDAQKEIADKNFQNAKTYLERALPLLSADKPREKSMIDNIKKLLPQIEAQLK